MTTQPLVNHALATSLLTCALALAGGCDSQETIEPQDLDGLELQDLEQLSPAELEALELAFDEQLEEEAWAGAEDFQFGASSEEQTFSIRYLDWNGGRAGDAENTAGWRNGNDLGVPGLDLSGAELGGNSLLSSGWRVNAQGNLTHDGASGQALLNHQFAFVDEYDADVEVRIVEVDTQRTFHEYRMMYRIDNQAWKPMCSDPANPWAVVLGDVHAVNKNGPIRYHNIEQMSIQCTSRAVGKAKRWGYDPNIDGDDVYMAAVRMVTADYCGTGRSFTADGVPLEQVYAGGASRAPGAYAEAGWDEHGVVCLNYAYSRSVHALSVVQSECGGVLPPPCSASQERSALTWSRLIFECGNGIVEPGEACDQGANNGGECDLQCQWDWSEID